MQIWRRLGTPLSDPTEEKNWRRLLHRAIDAKNTCRHSDLPDHNCRLLCGEPNESMLHMLRCTHVRPYWRACDSFATTVLGMTHHARDPIEVAVFNVDCNLKLSTKHHAPFSATPSDGGTPHSRASTERAPSSSGNPPSTRHSQSPGRRS